MLQQMLFVLQTKQNEEDALRERFLALQAALSHEVSRDVKGIESRVFFVQETQSLFLREVTDLVPEKDVTLIASNVPALVKALRDAGYFSVGLIEGAATESDFPGTRFLFAEFDAVEADSYVKAYQRLHGDPWTILETKRCLLRESTVDDIDAFYGIYADEKMTEFMEGLFDDPADEKRYMQDYIDKVYALMGYGVWTVIQKEEGRIIGRAGFSLRSGFADTELGFLIALPYQGQGYATEIIESVLQYGREVLLLDKVQALVKDRNRVSVHLLKKFGFKAEREVRIEEYIYGDDYRQLSAVGLSDIRYGSYLLMRKEWA